MFISVYYHIISSWVFAPLQFAVTNMLETPSETVMQWCSCTVLYNAEYLTAYRCLLAQTLCSVSVRAVAWGRANEEVWWGDWAIISTQLPEAAAGHTTRLSVHLLPLRPLWTPASLLPCLSCISSLSRTTMSWRPLSWWDEMQAWSHGKKELFLQKKPLYRRKWAD